MQKITLTHTEKEALLKAVTQAEKKTSGEISTAIIKESSDYIFYEMIFALLAGLITALLLIIFGKSWHQFCTRISWNLSAPAFNAISIGLVFLVMGLGFLLGNTAFIDRLIVPKHIMAARVKERAMLHFYSSGLTETQGRCAVLIFVSVNERRVELLADSGINEKIDAQIWDKLVSNLVDNIAKGQVARGIEEAVLQCGELMTQHFPFEGTKKNQLTDTIQVLEL